jgi:hypothetical protein
MAKIGKLKKRGVGGWRVLENFTSFFEELWVYGGGGCLL